MLNWTATDFWISSPTTDHDNSVSLRLQRPSPPSTSDNERLKTVNMVTTRSSQGSSPQPSAKQSNKRSANTSSAPAAKRGKANKAATENDEAKGVGNAHKEQKTIEEVMDVSEDIEADEDVEKQINGDDADKAQKDEGKDKNEDIEKEDELKAREDAVKKREEALDQQEETEDDDGREKVGKVDEAQDTAQKSNSNEEKNAFEKVKADESEVKEAAQEEQAATTKIIDDNNDSIVKDDKREAMVPSSVLEKGIIYFFFRGRVGIEDPQGIDDIARSYIVLRPLPTGAKIGEGPLEDTGNARALALPKKMLPKSGRDRFLVFVDKAKVPIKDLREQFAGDEYATKTSGTSKVPAATPFAEGVYAITTTGRESHLAYHTTVPSHIGEVQKELGLYKKGSFVLSVKNPETPSPANASISNPAKYSEEIQKKFRGRRWMPVEPEVLDYDNTQVLLIGEGQGDVRKATEGLKEDEQNTETPGEELEKLGEEDHDRVQHLKEDDPVFADLGLSSKQYTKIDTTW